MPRVLPYTCTYMHSLLYVPLSISFEVIKEKEKADSTLRSSRAVPHPSTNRALRRLTSEVRRDPVYSTRYGRRRYHYFCLLVYFAKNQIDIEIMRKSMLQVTGLVIEMIWSICF